MLKQIHRNVLITEVSKLSFYETDKIFLPGVKMIIENGKVVLRVNAIPEVMSRGARI